MDPRYRFTIVISFMMLAWWVYVVLSTYLIGPRGLNWERYLQGIAWVGAATAAGFLLVWTATQLIAWQKRRKTGFEAEVVDEFGTVFEMADAAGTMRPYGLSLSKFLPQLVAPPSWPGLTPLEAELMGFLNAYRNWPIDLAHPDVTLYEQALARWQVMRHLPGTGPWHRVIALSKDLAFVHAYSEVRKTHPFHEFWKRDSVNYVKRCVPHGGITAFVLSTLPAFRALGNSADGQTIQRALLTCLRYHENPALLPLNAGPLARELLDYLWRADAQLKHLDVGDFDEMTPELLGQLREEIQEHWLAALSDVQATDTPSDGLQAFKQEDGTVWLAQAVLLDKLGHLFSPTLRQKLQLWDAQGGTKHPAWPHLGPALMDEGLIANMHDGIAAVNECFSLRIGDTSTPPMVKLVLDPARHLPLVKQWLSVSGYKGPLDVILDIDQLTTMASAKAVSVDNRMGELF